MELVSTRPLAIARAETVLAGLLAALSSLAVIAFAPPGGDTPAHLYRTDLLPARRDPLGQPVVRAATTRSRPTASSTTSRRRSSGTPPSSPRAAIAAAALSRRSRTPSGETPRAGPPDLRRPRCRAAVHRDVQLRARAAPPRSRRSRLLQVERTRLALVARRPRSPPAHWRSRSCCSSSLAAALAPGAAPTRVRSRPRRARRRRARDPRALPERGPLPVQRPLAPGRRSRRARSAARSRPGLRAAACSPRSSRSGERCASPHTSIPTPLGDNLDPPARARGPARARSPRVLARFRPRVARGRGAGRRRRVQRQPGRLGRAEARRTTRRRRSEAYWTPALDFLRSQPRPRAPRRGRAHVRALGGVVGAARRVPARARVVPPARRRPEPGAVRATARRPSAYRRWLRRMAVRYVLLPTGRLGPLGARREADLLRLGALGAPARLPQPRLADLELPDAPALLTGPAPATLVALTHERVEGASRRAGAYTLAHPRDAVLEGRGRRRLPRAGARRDDAASSRASPAGSCSPSARCGTAAARGAVRVVPDAPPRAPAPPRRARRSAGARGLRGRGGRGADRRDRDRDASRSSRHDRRRAAARRPAAEAARRDAEAGKRSSRPPAAAAATRSRTRARPATSARTSTTRSRRWSSSSTAVTNGKGAMPSFKGQLQRPGDPDVAAYVVQAIARQSRLPPGLPPRRRRVRVRLRPDARLGGRRPAPAHASPAVAAARDAGHPRDRRHRPHVPLGAAVPRASSGWTTRSSATRARSSPSPERATSSCHEPIPLELAREAMAAVVAEGYHLNCYVDDELYVAEVTAEARAYADFQNLPIHAVGDLLEWLDAPPTKLVAVGDPDALDGLEARLRARFDGRLFISKSLPYFLELASPGVSKGVGPRVRRRAARASARSGRSRSATARTTSSCSSGPATASPSRTRTERVLARRRLGLPAGGGGRRGDMLEAT